MTVNRAKTARRLFLLNLAHEITTELEGWFHEYSVWCLHCKRPNPDCVCAWLGEAKCGCGQFWGDCDCPIESVTGSCPCEETRRYGDMPCIQCELRQPGWGGDETPEATTAVVPTLRYSVKTQFYANSSSFWAETTEDPNAVADLLKAHCNALCSDQWVEEMMTGFPISYEIVDTAGLYSKGRRVAGLIWVTIEEVWESWEGGEDKITLGDAPSGEDRTEFNDPFAID